jgi:pimeloyl-ACP methyl ester carboxylesterase
MPTVVVDGEEFHYRERGEGPATAVYVHPYFLDSSFWLDALEATRDARRAIAVDLRGHGRSERLGRRTASPERDADELNRVLDALGVAGPVDWVGAAAGGIVAALAVLARPERARSLALTSTIFMKGADAALKPFFDERAKLAVLEERGVLFRRMNEYVFGPRASLAARARYHTMFHEAPAETLVAVMTSDALAGRPDVPARLHVPVCLLYGADDATMTPERRELLVGRIERLTLEALPEGGRLLPIEYPDEFVAGLRRFWASVG